MYSDFLLIFRMGVVIITCCTHIWCFGGGGNSNSSRWSVTQDSVQTKLIFTTLPQFVDFLDITSVFSQGYTLNIGVHSAVSQYLIPMGSVELNPRSKRTKSDADYWPGTSNQPLSIVYNDQLVTIGNYTLTMYKVQRPRGDIQLNLSN